jgi:hypothetical protein
MTEMEYILQNPDLYAWVIKEFPIGCEITIQYVKPVVCAVIGYEVRDGQLVLNTQGEHGGPSGIHLCRAYSVTPSQRL